MNTKEKGAITTADNIADKRQIDWEQRRYEIAKDMLALSTLMLATRSESQIRNGNLSIRVYRAVQEKL